MNDTKYIQIKDCIHGGLYKIDSRNLSLGIYNENKNEFIGIRRKFGYLYLFEEFHYDIGPPYGTVKPIKLIEKSPLKDEDVNKKTKSIEENNVVINYLLEKGA